MSASQRGQCAKLKANFDELNPQSSEATETPLEAQETPLQVATQPKKARGRKTTDSTETLQKSERVTSSFQAASATVGHPDETLAAIEIHSKASRPPEKITIDDYLREIASSPRAPSWSCKSMQKVLCPARH
jgi:hypothetical protein